MNEKNENTFHLFRAPGEPGYIQGATTSAGRFDFADTGDVNWNSAIDAAAGDVIADLGLTWLGNGDLVGECGLLLPIDYMERITAAAYQAGDDYCCDDDPEDRGYSDGQRDRIAGVVLEVSDHGCHSSNRRTPWGDCECINSAYLVGYFDGYDDNDLEFEDV